MLRANEAILPALSWTLVPGRVAVDGNASYLDLYAVNAEYGALGLYIPRSNG